eukprot:3189054-Alexandrium_andersonii.AAC.1
MRCKRTRQPQSFVTRRAGGAARANVRKLRGAQVAATARSSTVKRRNPSCRDCFGTTNRPALMQRARNCLLPPRS